MSSSHFHYNCAQFHYKSKRSTPSPSTGCTSSHLLECHVNRPSDILRRCFTSSQIQNMHQSFVEDDLVKIIRPENRKCLTTGYGRTWKTYLEVSSWFVWNNISKKFHKKWKGFPAATEAGVSISKHLLQRQEKKSNSQTSDNIQYLLLNPQTIVNNLMKLWYDLIP